MSYLPAFCSLEITQTYWEKKHLIDGKHVRFYKYRQCICSTWRQSPDSLKNKNTTFFLSSWVRRNFLDIVNGCLQQIPNYLACSYSVGKHYTYRCFFLCVRTHCFHLSQWCTVCVHLHRAGKYIPNTAGHSWFMSRSLLMPGVMCWAWSYPRVVRS